MFIFHAEHFILTLHIYSMGHLSHSCVHSLSLRSRFGLVRSVGTKNTLSNTTHCLNFHTIYIRFEYSQVRTKEFHAEVKFRWYVLVMYGLYCSPMWCIHPHFVIAPRFGKKSYWASFFKKSKTCLERKIRFKSGDKKSVFQNNFLDHKIQFKK